VSVATKSDCSPLMSSCCQTGHWPAGSDLPSIKPVISQSALAGVFLVALALVMTPGPNMMYLVSRSITQGRRAGVISLGGVAVGFLIYLAATNLGLSAIFVAVPKLYLALRIAGAGYLAWLAFNALRPGGQAVFAPTAMSPDSPRRLFTMGMMTNLLNPKIAVLYLSLIPQFVRPAAGHVLLQGFLLGAVQITVALTGNLMILLAAGTIASFFASRPGWLRVQRYLMGSVLGLLALKIATDRARPAVG
jgi:threonine/homoserine/homoserine lactone efflux protein